MTRINSRLIQALAVFAATFFAMASLAGCSGLFSGQIFKERAAETPAPDESMIDKSFFVDASGKPKTFLCAWAPEVGRGWAESFIAPFVNEQAHCNVEFEVTESYLVAKVINPSYLDQRDRWTEMLKIPISKHFYYERNKDAHGRETNEWIENSSRSHWSARPKMKLDLAHTEIPSLTSQEGSWGWRATSVEDIEWDYARNFLGFSINMILHTPGGGDHGNDGARFRVNFLKFDHDPTFKKVPYHQENSRFMNVLHVMGRYIDGTEPELYAAHWDVRKPTRIYISGAPKEQQQAIVAAVYKWNKEFVKIGAVKDGQLAFEPVILELKHPFDLRYPSVTWISDRKISANAPLGIGMAHADVRNGKILWGGVVLFGGMLETYINSYAPVESTPPSTSSGKVFSPFDTLSSMFQSAVPVVKMLDPTTSYSRESLMQKFPMHEDLLAARLTQMTASGTPQEKKQAETLRAQLRDLQLKDPGFNKILADLSKQLGEQSNIAGAYFRNHKVQDLLGSAGGAKTPALSDLLAQNGQKRLGEALKESDLTKRKAMFKSVTPNSSPFFVESDLTIENLNGSFMNSSAQKLRTYPEILDSVVASLVVHELGHVMGLGHQFKENIVPEAGTVPSHYVRELSEKATAEKEFTNMTSVMGYQSGRTEMMTPASDYVPGPQDDLVMRYMYKGEYAAYDKDSDSFAYIAVPATGKIPDKTMVGEIGVIPTSYFPQCNDYEASLGADPFCNRFDRGSKAVDIVNSYFEYISDNLLANLYSVVGAGGNSSYAEWRLWNRAFDTMSRVRMFYDEMRRRLRSDAHLRPLWAQLRNDEKSLYEFSQACNQPDPTGEKVHSTILRKIFEDPAIVDLCRANGNAIKEYSFFLNLPESDYTRIDHNNRYIQGGYLAGDAVLNAGHIFGSWYQLSNLPLKFTSLYTLTTSDPFMIWGGYLTPNPYYDSEENRVQYRTLYPYEYTRLIADTVKSNMRFGAGGKDDTIIGRPVIAAGSMLAYQRYTSNDAAKLPDEFNDVLNQQTQFNFSMVAVLIDAVEPDSSNNVKADHYKKFTASIYDFMTGVPATTRDVFLLPNGRVFVWANGMFIFPMTKIKFYKGTHAYVLAYKVAYDQGPLDPLFQDGLKQTLTQKHDEIAKNCVNGFDGNGLLGYFDTANANFEGFKILSGIAEESDNGEKLRAFYLSLQEEFNKYEATNNSKIPGSYPIKTMSRVCEEAVRGVGQISAAAAMANGFWLGITSDYMEK